MEKKALGFAKVKKNSQELRIKKKGKKGPRHLRVSVSSRPIDIEVSKPSAHRRAQMLETNVNASRTFHGQEPTIKNVPK